MSAGTGQYRFAFKHFMASLETFYYIHFCLLEFRQQINYGEHERSEASEAGAHYFSIFELTFAN